LIWLGITIVILHLERWTIFRPALVFVIHPRRGDIHVPQPELDLGNVRLVIQGIGGGGSAQGMHGHARDRIDEPYLTGIVLHDVAVDGCRIQAALRTSGV
jgi:hypothetical protein